ncbi:MAG: PDZ domain-containing protein [Lachnospiraceae bacterium]|nr:PDZ domain-containing protein [Lachnospiraceae bacterium]
MLTGDFPLALPLGTILAGQYEIDGILGQGGFGITYRALDHKSGEKVALTGKLPPDSIDRLDEDKIVPISSLGIDIPEVADKAVMKALSVRAEERFQSMEDFKMALFGRQLAVAKPSPVKQRYFTAPDADPKDEFKTVLMDNNSVQQSFKQIPNDHIRPKRSHSDDAGGEDQASELRPRGNARAGAASGRVSRAGRTGQRSRRSRRVTGILAGPLILYVVIAGASLLFSIALILLSHKLFKTDTAAEKAEAATEEETSENGDSDTEDSGSSGADVETSAAAETAADDTSGETRGKAELGIIGYTILDDMKEETGLRGGVYINDVQEGKGAEAAGMHAGDIITEIEQRTILDMESLKGVLSYHKPGDAIKVKILRPEDGGYVEKEIEVRLSAMEEI